MRRRATTILLSLLALMVIAALALYLASRRPPSWWNPPSPDEPRAAAMAESFEQQFASEISRVRTDTAPWAVTIGEPQLNAWLAIRLPRWLEHAGAPADAVVQAHVGAEAIELAVRPTANAPVGVVEAVPVLLDGKLSLTLGRVGIGAIGLPGVSAGAITATLDSLDDAADHDHMTRAALALLRGEIVAAQFDLGDGRRVELIDLELRSGAIVVQLRTLSRARVDSDDSGPRRPK